MVVRIRLQRFGRRNRPFYRIVSADSRSPRDGRFLEILGTYNPIADKDGIKEVRLKTERIGYWLSVGAQPSERVSWLLGMYNILPPMPRRATSVQHVPRKERKEAAEGKKFHTAAFGSVPVFNLPSPFALSSFMAPTLPGLGSLKVHAQWAVDALARVGERR